MAGYDPQRTRHRPRPANGSTAPVDAILDGPEEEPVDDAPAPTTDDEATSEPAVGDAAAAAAPGPEPEVDAPEPEPAPEPTPPTAVPTPAVDLSSVPPPPSSPSPARLLIGGGIVAFVLALLLWRRLRGGSDDGTDVAEG